MRIGSRVMLKRKITRKALGAGVEVTLEPKTQGVIEDIWLTRDCGVRWDGNGLRTLAPADVLRDLGEFDEFVIAGHSLYLGLDRFEDSPFQPRTEYNQERLFELAESMIQHGFVGRLLGRPVVPPGEAVGHVELAYGHRRIRAARIAELEAVPVELRLLSDRDMAELALLENLQREDLTIEEEAAAYARLRDRFALSIRELAHRTGSSKSRVERLLLLTDAAPEVLEGMAKGILSQTTADAVAREVPVEDQAAVVLAMNQVGGSEKDRAKRIQQAKEIQAWLDRGHPPLEKIVDPIERNYFRAIHHAWAGLENRYARALQITERVKGKQPEHWSRWDAERVLNTMARGIESVAEEAGWTCETCQLQWLGEMDTSLSWFYDCGESESWCRGYVPAGEDGVSISWSWKDAIEELEIEKLGEDVVSIADVRRIIEHVPMVQEQKQADRLQKKVDVARGHVANFRRALDNTCRDAYCARNCNTCALHLDDGRCQAAEEGVGFLWAFNGYRRKRDGLVVARCNHHELRPGAVPMTLPASAGRLAPEVAGWLAKGASGLAELAWKMNDQKIRGGGVLLSPSLEQEEWETIDDSEWWIEVEENVEENE